MAMFQRSYRSSRHVLNALPLPCIKVVTKAAVMVFRMMMIPSFKSCNDCSKNYCHHHHQQHHCHYYARLHIGAQVLGVCGSGPVFHGCLLMHWHCWLNRWPDTSADAHACQALAVVIIAHVQGDSHDETGPGAIACRLMS